MDTGVVEERQTQGDERVTPQIACPTSGRAGSNPADTFY